MDEMRESPAGMSMWGLYQTCPRRWAFKYALGFVKDVPRAHYFAHGSAMHEGKRIFYSTRNLQAAKDKALQVVNDAADSFESILNEEKLVDALFDVWYEKFGKTFFDDFDPIANETENIIKLPNGAEITVRPDQIVREKTTGNIFVFDTKTTGGSLTTTIADQEFKSQPLLYIASIYKSEPWWITDFRGWVTEVMYGRINYTKKGMFSSISADCARSEPILYSEDAVDVFLESIMTLTSDAAYSYQAFKTGAPMSACFAMNRNSCKHYSSVCPYWPICFNNYEFDSEPPAPFILDPWKSEGTIEDVVNKISS